MQFTIRSVMAAILSVAGLLGVARVQPHLLPLVIFVGIPIVALTERVAHVPPNRPAWRAWIAAAIGGFTILGAGWLWTRTAIWYVRQRANGDPIVWEAYESWTLALPFHATWIGLVMYVLALACACWRRRRRRLLWLVLVYAVLLAVSWFILFLTLLFRAFLD